MKTVISYTTMKMDFLRGLLILLAIPGMLVLTLTPVLGQTNYRQVAGSQIKVTGTSNLHDWDMVATNFTLAATIKTAGGQLQDLTALSFVLPVNNLKSNEDLLNTRAYNALKAEQFDKITFKLTKATIIPQQKIIKATGNLTISGVTNPVELQTNYVVNADESITCKGSQTIKMSDYKIKAPTFMMGALKTGDVVTIDMLLKLKKADQLSTAK